MGTSKWEAPAAIQTALSTDLNNLANGSYSAASAAIDNATSLSPYIDLELYLASLTPTANASISIYALYSVDATNYGDGGGATAPSMGSMIAVFDLSTAAAAKRHTKVNILVGPFLFKLVLLNSAGVALAATLNTLKYRLHNASY